MPAAVRRLLSALAVVLLTVGYYGLRHRGRGY
jgi:hypothetical protein